MSRVADQRLAITVADVQERVVGLAVSEAEVLRDRPVSPADKFTRPTFDAYYTPLAVATACVGAVWNVKTRRVLRVVEPAVGAGAWVKALRARQEGVGVVGVDVDPKAPGLDLCDLAITDDYLQRAPSLRADLVIGNPPYGGDICAWVDASLQVAPMVAFLLRGTFLGSKGRAKWWRSFPPSDVFVLTSRPRWEGPGAQPSADSVDSVLVVWKNDGDLAAPTLLHWLDVVPPAIAPRDVPRG